MCIILFYYISYSCALFCFIVFLHSYESFSLSYCLLKFMLYIDSLYIFGLVTCVTQNRFEDNCSFFDCLHVYLSLVDKILENLRIKTIFSHVQFEVTLVQ